MCKLLNSSPCLSFLVYGGGFLAGAVIVSWLVATIVRRIWPDSKWYEGRAPLTMWIPILGGIGGSWAINTLLGC